MLRYRYHTDKYFSKLKLFFCCITCKHREEGEGGKLEVGWPRDSSWHSCPPLRLLSAHPCCFPAKPVVYRPLALRIFSAVKERGSTPILLRWVGFHRISLFKLTIKGCKKVFRYCDFIKIKNERYFRFLTQVTLFSTMFFRRRKTKIGKRL